MTAAAVETRGPRDVVRDFFEALFAGTPDRAVQAALESGRGAPLEKKTSMFGVIALEDGELAAMDGGTHGVSGHTARVLPDGSVRWERRVDSMGHDSNEGKGQVTLDAEERARLAGWADAAFELGGPAKPWPLPPPAGSPPAVNPPPPWCWAVLVRRGDEIRVVQGDTWTGTPPKLAPLLDWLRARVDAACTP
jgi:hypothetical protein